MSFLLLELLISRSEKLEEGSNLIAGVSLVFLVLVFHSARILYL